VSGVVRAAGGVLLRRRDGVLQTLLVHRPKYDDLTFPKGKALEGEPDEETARREVVEETGLRCELGPELVSTAYRDPQDRPKRVRYWLMKADGRRTRFEPDDEIDRVAWVDAADAPEVLTYARDRQVLDAALALAEPVYLIRHAKAGSRQMWHGEDDLRPLTTKGVRQAAGIAASFEDRPVARVLSSPTVRCVDTVEPIARRHGLRVETVAWLGVGASPDVTRAAVLGLGGPAVVCSHGEVIPHLVEALAEAGTPWEGPLVWRKGSTWVLERDDGFPSRLRYEPPPRDRAPRD
jgi:8-oxo-(d)GTP phosphatase